MTMTLNTTSRAKTTISGMISALREVRIHLESFGEAPISSLEANSMIRKMAIIAPPTPRPIGIVIDMALEAAVVLVVAAVVAVVMTVDSISPRSIKAVTSFK
jgi:hypothetical protein